MTTTFKTSFVCPECGHKFMRVHKADDLINCPECTYSDTATIRLVGNSAGPATSVVDNSDG